MAAVNTLGAGGLATTGSAAGTCAGVSAATSGRETRAATPGLALPAKVTATIPT